MKKILTILMMVCMLSVVACGKKEENTPQTTNATNSNNTSSTQANTNSGDVNNSKYNFNYENMFAGYKVKYPVEINSMNIFDYGYAYSYGADYSVFIGAPATGGVYIETPNFEGIVDKTQEYIFKSLERRNKDMFTVDMTTLTVKSEKNTTINGISAKKVVGTFNNTEKNTNVDCVIYYLLAGEKNSYPVYIVGVPLAASSKTAADLEEYMDAFVGCIKK